MFAADSQEASDSSALESMKAQSEAILALEAKAREDAAAWATAKKTFETTAAEAIGQITKCVRAVHVCVLVRVCACACMCVCMYVRVHVCACVSVFTFVLLCANVCVSLLTLLYALSLWVVLLCVCECVPPGT